MSARPSVIRAFKPGTLRKVIRYCGLGPFTVMFFVLFFLCSAMLWLADPEPYSFWDGVWFSFQVVTTIGFGDLATSSTVVRICSIVLSVASIFYLALITGAVVSYCSEITKIRHEDTLSGLIDKLENLENLRPDELAELSANVRRYHDKVSRGRVEQPSQEES